MMTSGSHINGEDKTSCSGFCFSSCCRCHRPRSLSPALPLAGRDRANRSVQLACLPTTATVRPSYGPARTPRAFEIPALGRVARASADRQGTFFSAAVGLSDIRSGLLHTQPGGVAAVEAGQPIQSVAVPTDMTVRGAGSSPVGAVVPRSPQGDPAAAPSLFLRLSSSLPVDRPRVASSSLRRAAVLFRGTA